MLAAGHALESRSVAARPRALAAPLSALHGEVGALLVPALGDRRRAPAPSRCTAARPTTRRSRPPSALARGGQRDRDVPRGHAAAERAPEEIRGAARTPAPRGSRSRPACRSSRRGSRAPTGCAASSAGGCATARRSTSTTCTARTIAEAARTRDRPADGGDPRARGIAVSGLLLAIDGDSLAHRAYHALPKSIRLNALVGFANFLQRLWERSSRRRSSSAGTRSRRRPTGTRRSRPTSRAACSRTRSSSSSTSCPLSSSRSASRPRKAPRLRGRRLPGGRGAGMAGAGARRDLRPRRVPARLRSRHDPAAGQGRLRARADRPGRGARALRRRARPRFRTSSRCAATRRTRSRALPASARRRRPTC